MNKRYFSYNEALYCFIFYLVIVAAWESYCIFILQKTNFLLFAYMVIPYILFVIYLLYKQFHSKKYLPAKCIFNPMGFIELHIGKANNNEILKFYRLCAEAILKARSMNKDVLIDTWIVTPSQMLDRFGDACKIKKSSIFQKLSNFENKLRFNRKKIFTNKCYRYVIYTNKLTEDQVKYLKKLIR